MAKVKILVVEDEIIIADDICEILTDVGYEVLEPAISYTEAAAALKKFSPDLVMIDIRLSGKKDGIELASLINTAYYIPYLFLTSNADKHTIERAKSVSPWAYLVKPFNKDELYSSIEIALSNFEKQKKYHEAQSSPLSKNALFIKQKNLFVKVKFDDILFLQADHVYVEIITSDQNKFVARGSLNDYTSKLDNQFARIHRGFIINLQHIDSIDNDYANISNHQIPIGKNYREELLRRIHLG